VAGCCLGRLLVQGDQGYEGKDSDGHEIPIESENAEAGGFARGASHVFVATGGAGDQADAFLNVVQRQPGDLPQVADVERLPNVDTVSTFARRNSGTLLGERPGLQLSGIRSNIGSGDQPNSTAARALIAEPAPSCS
jgi:hypothetical protein